VANRHIAHMDLDTFFVSVERLLNNELHGKPVLVGGSGDRGVVASCSYEARKFGIHSAMPMRMAKQLCPEAVIVRGDLDQYAKYSGIITDIIKDAVPAYEKTSIDEFYIDFTGMDRFFGCYKIAGELRQRIIKETNLPISFALSGNKTVSKVGTGEAKPNGQLEIAAGAEKSFLAPLSVRKIPMVGEKTYQILRSMGVEKIATVQAMPIELMEQVLGSNGVAIWKKANGLDTSPVVPYNERKSISTETTFEKDTIDIQYINRILVSMTEKLGYQLRQEHKLTSCITVKIRYSDFNTYTQQIKIGYTALDHTILETVKGLFNKLYNKRMLIRLVGIKLSNLVASSFQYDLFDNSMEQIKLYHTLDDIKNKYGKGAVMRSSSLGIKQSDPNLFKK
jgi:DNA polymerase IV